MTRAYLILAGILAFGALVHSAEAQESTLYQQTQYNKDWEFYAQQRPQNVAGTYRALTSKK